MSVYVWIDETRRDEGMYGQMDGWEMGVGLRSDGRRRPNQQGQEVGTEREDRTKRKEPTTPALSLVPPPPVVECLATRLPPSAPPLQ